MKKDPKDLLKTPDKKTIAAIKKKEKEINLKIGKELDKILFKPLYDLLNQEFSTKK